MHDYNDVDKSIIQILGKCESMVSTYPHSLSTYGIATLKKLRLLKDCERRSGGFCYLMPFWFQDAFSLSHDFCCQLSLGNIFGLLYFMSQDEVMDGGSNVDNTHLLPLSSLFYNDFISCYRNLFPSDSVFWSHFTKYLQEWAKSVTWEREEHVGSIKPYCEDDLILLSRKAAGMKIPFAAICIASGKFELIARFESLVDYDQIVYQMIDDWRDWKTDIETKHYTHFLIKVMEYCGIDDSETLTESHVKKAVFNGNVLEAVMEMALLYNKKSVECIEAINVPKLHRYLEMEKNETMKILQKIKGQKEAALWGGLDLYFNPIKQSREDKGNAV